MICHPPDEETEILSIIRDLCQTCHLMQKQAHKTQGRNIHSYVVPDNYLPDPEDRLDQKGLLRGPSEFYTFYYF